MGSARVAAVSWAAHYEFSKQPVTSITLLTGLGVEGDAHAGRTVQHRSRVRRDPTQPNLRQVHLLHRELFDEAAARGYHLRAGDLGENILTEGLDLLTLPEGARLHLGGAVIRVTGLRNPCRQIEQFRPGLLRVVVARADGEPNTAHPTLGPTGGVESLDGAPIVRKAGIMGVVEQGGVVAPGMPIRVHLPPLPHQPLQPV